MFKKVFVFFLLLSLNTSCTKPQGDGIVVKNYYPDGKIYEEIESTKDSVPDGLWKIYYPNGNLKVRAAYKNGEMAGKTERYYESGNLREVGDFVNGLRIGRHVVFFDSKDRVMGEADYVLVKDREWANTYIEYDSISGNVSAKSPRVYLNRSGDTLVVKLTDNEFKLMRVVTGDYDSLFNLRDPNSLDTTSATNFVSKVLINNQHRSSGVIRGFAENYEWVKEDDPLTDKTISRGTFFEYRMD